MHYSKTSTTLYLQWSSHDLLRRTFQEALDCLRGVPGEIRCDAPGHAPRKELVAVSLLFTLGAGKRISGQVCLHAGSDRAITDFFSARVARRRCMTWRP